MRSVLVPLALVAVTACGSTTTDPAPTGSSSPGGSASSVGGGAMGGSTASGGAGAGGASVGIGGASATGGTTSATGGTSAAGGAIGKGGTSATGGASGSSGASGKGGGAGGACGSECTKAGNTCCNGVCVNTDNDIHNCGACGTVCKQDPSFCGQGTCGAPPCTTAKDCGAGNACCGNACCQSGQLCCDVPGPVSMGVTCVAPTDSGTCPVGCKQCKCNAPDTPIATPFGNRAIASLREGDLVYSIDRGRVVAVPIARTHSVDAPDHVVVRVTLESGVVLEISAPHPTADGRTFGDLRTGGSLDGARIVDARLVRFRHDRTYDILPASETATYFAGGVAIGSTLGAASVATTISSASRPASETLR